MRRKPARLNAAEILPAKCQADFVRFQRRCIWKGFDHEQSEGPWNYQCEQNDYLLAVAPHSTWEYSVAIADEGGEYACYAGMWWTPENKPAVKWTYWQKK